MPYSPQDGNALRAFILCIIDYMTEIVVNSLHTDEMVKAEMRSMLGAARIRLTLGALESLWLLDSPYIIGGEVTPEALAMAMEIVKHDDIEPLEFHKLLVEELEAAFRAYEIIQPDDKPDTGKHSSIEKFGPEWLADTISQASRAMPSLTYHQVLYEVPLAMVLHLVVANARYNGAITERPNDITDALRQLREHNRKKKESNNG